MINKPNRKCSLDNMPIESESRGSKLEELASIYKSESFVLSGIDNEAKNNNKQVIKAIAAVKEKLRDRVNDIFAVQMGGSRIRAENTSLFLTTLQ